MLVQGAKAQELEALGEDIESASGSACDYVGGFGHMPKRFFAHRKFENKEKKIRVFCPQITQIDHANHAKKRGRTRGRHRYKSFMLE